MTAKDIPALIQEILDQHGEVSVGQLSAPTGLTRQAIQYHLRKMVGQGELEPVGEGRARHYKAVYVYDEAFPTEGADEYRARTALRAAVAELKKIAGAAGKITDFAFAEMMNNALDHSGSETVRVTLRIEEHRLGFGIIDFGVGAFEHVRRKAGLEDHLAALQEISKGKMTTDPSRHTGQGIFFTSKAVDRFSLAANGWRWLVDNDADDQTVETSDIRRGTVVHFDIDPSTDRSLKELFDRYTDEETYEFDRSRTVVHLFQADVPFVSRAEAKRVGRNLDRFQEVVVDFKDVSSVGQGFADELFRVWAKEHPSTRLIPVNMNEAVRRMVEGSFRLGV